MSRLRWLSMVLPTGGAMMINRRRNVTAKSDLEHTYDLRWDKKPEHEGTRVLYFVRHGRYDILNKDEDQQWLTKLGREQLIETGKHLSKIYAEHHNNEPPELIISSTMVRAKESRDLIMSQFTEGFFSKPEETDLLRECAVTVPVQRQGNKKYYEDKYQRSAEIGINCLEAAIQGYCHRGDHKSGERTAIIGKLYESL